VKYSEYWVQKGLGTLDYCQVARKTRSIKVLQDILNTVGDKNIKVLLAIVMNPNTPVKMLDYLVMDSTAPDEVAIMCVMHPKVDLRRVQRWMLCGKYGDNSTVRRKYRSLQRFAGYKDEELIAIDSKINAVSWALPSYISGGKSSQFGVNDEEEE